MSTDEHLMTGHLFNFKLRTEMVIEWKPAMKNVAWPLVNGPHVVIKGLGGRLTLHTAHSLL